MSLSLLLALVLAPGPGFVELERASWDAMRALPPAELPVPAWAASRTLTLTPVPGGLQLRARWELRSLSPGAWFSGQVLGDMPGLRLEDLRWNGKPAAVAVGSGGVTVAGKVSGRATIELQAFVPGDPLQAPLLLQVLPATRGRSEAGAPGGLVAALRVPGEAGAVLRPDAAFWSGAGALELYRRTEGSFGATTVLGFDLEGELLAPPPVQRRIEIIGDSITAGYGNEGVAPCSFSAETENHYLTYGALAARALGAELSTIAWSGKGVVYNFADDVFEPLPQVYDRLLAAEPTAWDFSWQPDVVVINLGTNDFSTGNDPPEGVFVPAYVELLAHLRAVYPDAFILAVAPSLFGAEVALVAGYLQSAVDQRQLAGDAEVGFADINVQWIGSGCDGHPSLATHAGMAMRLTSELQAQLGW